MKNFDPIVLILLFIGLLQSCKKDKTETPVTKVKDVYVSGYEWNGTANVSKYWKNGTAISTFVNTNHAFSRTRNFYKINYR